MPASKYSKADKERKEKEKRKREKESRKLLGRTGMAGKAADEMLKRRAYLEAL